MGVGMGIREQNYKERQILTECRDKRGGESWGTLECVGLGVRVCIILYILLYIIILLWGLGGGDGSATPSEQMAAVLEFGNNPPM